MPAKKTPAQKLDQELRSIHADMESLNHIGQTSISTAHRIGGLLIEAKSLVKHGEWLPWLADVGIKATTATSYMRIHREFILEDAERVGISVGDAIQIITERKRDGGQS